MLVKNFIVLIFMFVMGMSIFGTKPAPKRDVSSVKKHCIFVERSGMIKKICEVK